MTPVVPAGVTTLTGTLPDGSSYSVPTFVPNQAAVTAGGNGFLLTNWDGFSTDYHGLEFNAVKRLSNRWMGRIGLSFNSPRTAISSIRPASPSRCDVSARYIRPRCR